MLQVYNLMESEPKPFPSCFPLSTLIGKITLLFFK